MPDPITAYIAAFPPETRRQLDEIRAIIRENAPEAIECITYQMPTYKMGQPVVYFAGYAKHIGFYPTPSAIRAFEPELTEYKWSKGAIQFPLSKPLPKELIASITRFRVAEVNSKK